MSHRWSGHHPTDADYEFERPLLLQRSAAQLRGVTHLLHNVLVSYDMQGARLQALFGVLVAKEGRCNHNPKEDAKLRRPKLLHCQPASYMMCGVHCATAAHGYAHARGWPASQCMHKGVMAVHL